MHAEVSSPLFSYWAVEEMFENFTVHLNDTARVSVIGTRYAVVDIREDEADQWWI